MKWTIWPFSFHANMLKYKDLRYGTYLAKTNSWGGRGD